MRISWRRDDMAVYGRTKEGKGKVAFFVFKKPGEQKRDLLIFRKTGKERPRFVFCTGQKGKRETSRR